MVLFLNPNEEKAQRAVRKLESLTADEYEDEIFRMQKLPQAVKGFGFIDPPPTPQTGIEKQRAMERYLSLSDAYIVRNDVEKALETLETAESIVGSNPEIDRRKHLLSGRTPQEIDIEITGNRPLPENQNTRRKVESLERMLTRIRDRRQPVGD